MMTCCYRRLIAGLWPLVPTVQDKACGIAAAQAIAGQVPRTTMGRRCINTATLEGLASGCMGQPRAPRSGWIHYSRHYQIPPSGSIAAANSLRSFSSGADKESGESSSSSDSDDSSDSDSEELGADSDDEEEEEGQWTRYRELGEGHVDDDADDTDALIPENRYRLPQGVRKAARSALGGDDEDEDWGDGEAGPLAVRPDGGASQVPLKQVYEDKLNQYTAEMAKFLEGLQSGAGKKMTMKEKLAAMNEQNAKDSMQVEGLPHIPSAIIEPGIAQLEALTAEHEWHMTIVDVKMTTKQTPQGKKSRFSSMVMVGNLQGKGAYGIGAAKEANDSIFKALRFAILGAINIPLYRRHTVYYPSRSKFIRTKISIFPRPSDFGISASPIITEACELLGIQNITVKTHNSRNIRNVVKGFFQALAHIPTAAEVAQAKGVYMRERVTRKLYSREFF